MVDNRSKLTENRTVSDAVSRRSYVRLIGGAVATTAGVGLGSRSITADDELEETDVALGNADDHNHIAFDDGWERWFTNTGAGILETVADDDRGTDVLRVAWPTGQYYGATMEYHMLDHHGYQPDAGHVRYWMYFPDDWEFHPDGLGGTKLPGFAGTYQTGDHDPSLDGGYGGRPSDGTNGWSTRPFNARPERADGNGPIGMGTQIYHAGEGGPHGDHPRWNTGLETDRWHRIDQYVELNTPGDADGSYRTWVDGDLALEIDDFYVRDVGYGDRIGIQTFWAVFYFGGDWGSPTDQEMLFDDLELWLWKETP